MPSEGRVAERETMWSQEAQAMLEAGVGARRVGLSLPEESELRGDLLAIADRWLLCAQLRGVRPTVEADASPSQSLQA
jgi:hypothetical protein